MDVVEPGQGPVDQKSDGVSGIHLVTHPGVRQVRVDVGVQPARRATGEVHTGIGYRQQPVQVRRNRPPALDPSVSNRNDRSVVAARCDDIDAIVADSCFANFGEIVSSEMYRQYKIPTFLSYPMFSLIKLFYRVDIRAISPVNCIDDVAPTPVLFIHGVDDETTPHSHSERLYGAYGHDNGQLWLVPGASHVRSYETEPDEYITRVTEFYDEVFK